MNHSPATILRQFLIDAGLVPVELDVQWSCYIASMPESPADALCAYDTSGTKDGRLMQGLVIERAGVQIKVRSTSYTDGWSKAEAVRMALDAILRTPVTVAGVNYIILVFIRSTGVVALGTEPGTTSRNVSFTINGLVAINQTTP
jgi:hypothetical protein